MQEKVLEKTPQKPLKNFQKVHRNTIVWARVPPNDRVRYLQGLQAKIPLKYQSWPL